MIVVCPECFDTVDVRKTPSSDMGHQEYMMPLHGRGTVSCVRTGFLVWQCYRCALLTFTSLGFDGDLYCPVCYLIIIQP